MGIPKQESVRKLGLSLSPLVGLIISPGYALEILMRLQVSPRKQAVAYNRPTRWIAFSAPFTSITSLTLATLALLSLGPAITLLKVEFTSD